ncbi:MAG: hypothetical protein AAF752_05060 [Bacteroidota bacterium]
MPACAILATLTLATGCDLFSTRTPEPPGGDVVPFLQPDTPERVVENLQTAVNELSEQNYVRSLSDAFTFQPTVDAEAREPLVWSNWSVTEERAYFDRLRAAAGPFDERSLQLIDVKRTAVDDERFVVDATYLLRIPHSRSDEGIPIEVQGQLIWTLVRGTDGLWRLAAWTDQALGSEPAWSDLKAAFFQ